MLLRTRLALLLTTYVLLIALGGGLVAVIAERSNDARASHHRQLAEVAFTERLNLSLVSQATAFRAFLLTGDETKLDGYESARADEARLTRELSTPDLTPEEARTLARVTSAAALWQTQAVEPLIELRDTSGVEAAASRFEDAASSQLFSSIQDELDLLVSQFEAQAAESDSVADRARVDTGWLALGVLVVAIGVTAAAAFAVRRWVTGPLTALENSVRRDVTAVIAGSAPPEIASLGHEINQMRQRIEAALDDSLRSHEGLAQNAAVLMSVRSRLESSPELMPPGWSVAASLTPATGVVAGDCYDIGWVRPTRLGLVVVDVAGHGAESAVVALRTKELLRAAMRTYVDLGEGVRWVNQQLDGLAPDMFVTAFAAILDTVTGSVDYVCAGHPPALLCRAGTVIELAATGPIIGPFEAVWHSQQATIAEGETLVVYTDGLTEVRDHEREEFGIYRLSDLVCEEFDDAEAVVKRCLDEAAAFSAVRGQDDLTLVAVCRTDPAGMPALSNG